MSVTLGTGTDKEYINKVLKLDIILKLWTDKIAERHCIHHMDFFTEVYNQYMKINSKHYERAYGLDEDIIRQAIYNTLVQFNRI